MWWKFTETEQTSILNRSEPGNKQHQQMLISIENTQVASDKVEKDTASLNEETGRLGIQVLLLQSQAYVAQSGRNASKANDPGSTTISEREKPVIPESARLVEERKNILRQVFIHATHVGIAMKAATRAGNMILVLLRCHLKHIADFCIGIEICSESRRAREATLAGRQSYTTCRGDVPSCAGVVFWKSLR